EDPTADRPRADDLARRLRRRRGLTRRQTGDSRPVTDDEGGKRNEFSSRPRHLCCVSQFITDRPRRGACRDWPCYDGGRDVYGHACSWCPPSIDGSFSHDRRTRAKPLEAIAQGVCAPAGEGCSDSALAEDVLDSQPVEPTAMEDEPGQQTVALLRGQMVPRGRDLALPDRMAEQGSERIDVGDSPSLR